ncbi:MAG: gliding motility-associated C-terminal domain-containing protein [Bacteroidales bacterium]|nr:gliding motility-associated C-terminal domain-containing protein [Bacteroidales bacterium]
MVALQDASSSCRWSQNTTIIPGLNHFLDQCDEWCLDAYQLVYADTAGYTNTQIIRSSLSTQNSIAATVVDFQNGWYLPAIGQLLKLFASRPFIEQEIIAAGGSMPAGQYWSSTLQNNNHAWMSVYGRPQDMPRQSFKQVRAIRSFTIPPAEYDTSLTYLWNTGDTTPYIQVTPSQTTTYTVTVTNEIGCQNSESQTILVAQSMPQNIYDQICQGEPYEDNGFSVTADETSVPGNLVRTRTITLNGCSSFLTLVLTVLPMDTLVQEVASCGPYNWHGQTYFQDGTYTQRFTSQSGCDSVEILHLTIHKGDTTYLSVDTCDGYQWFGQNYSYSGTYTHILENQHGCDSLVILNLTVRDPEITYYTQTVCEAELPVTWHDITLDQAGVYTFYAVNAQGCDSVERLTLTVTPPVYTYQTITAYGYYEYEDSVWNTSGTHTIHYTAQNGCDSIVILTLVIQQSDPTYVDSTVCASMLPLMWNGLQFTEAGQQTATLHPTPYYDSLVVMTLNVLPVPTTVIDTSVCELFVWNGMEYDDSGTYEQTFTAENGCDSVVTVHLSVFYSEMTEVDSLICPADLPFFWNGQTFTGPGQQTAHLLTTHQCDSMVIMTVTVGDTTAQWTDTTVCDRLNFHGTIYTTSGQYEQQLTNEDGCTYTHHIDVTVYQSDTTYLDTNVCNSSFPFVWHGLNFVNAGTKSLVLDNVHQCDSVLLLTVNRINISVTSFDTTVCGPFEWNGQVYDQSANLSQILTGSNGCDSIVFVHITVLPQYVTQWDTTICSTDLPLYWHGEWFTGPDVREFHYTTAYQCDSAVTLTVNVLPAPDTVFLDTVVCANQLPLWWRGAQFVAAGVQTVSLPASNGCDSVLVLSLQVYETPQPIVPFHDLIAGNSDTIPISVAGGNASDYTLEVLGAWCTLWHDSLLVVSPPAGLTETGQTVCTVTLTDSNGCTAEIVGTMNCYVHIQTDVFDTISSQDLPYDWQDMDLHVPGVYTVHLSTDHGADSSITLHLSVIYLYDTVFCNPNLPVVWQNHSFTESATCSESYPAGEGADSIVVVDVAIGFVEDTTAWMTVLENDLPLMFHGHSLDTSGIYVFQQNDEVGCASTLTVYVTVYYNVVTELDSAVCPSALPLEWNGLTFADAGVQSVAEVTSHGADSTVVMTVTLLPEPAVTISGASHLCVDSYLVLSAGGGETYLWSTGDTVSSVVVTSAGTYTVTATDGNGCVAAVNHTVAVYAPDPVAVLHPAVFCAGDTSVLSVGYQSTSTVVLEHGDGFDPMVMFHPITNMIVSGLWLQSESDSLFLLVVPNSLTHDTVLSISIVMYDDYGCGADTILPVSIHLPTEAVLDTIVLENDLPLHLNGDSYDSAGVYVQHLSNVQACDSLLTVHLSVLHNVQTTADSVLCEAALPLVWNGMTFASAGTQTALLTAVNGVDSAVVMTVTLLPASDTLLTVSVVENQLPYVLNGIAYQTTGVYTQHQTNAVGCDSAITLNLTVYQNVTVTKDTTVCAASLPMVWNGKTFTAAGTQTSQLTTTNGADSVVVLHLAVDAVSATVGNVTHITCFGASTGGAVATVTGGQQPLTLRWNNASGSVASTSATLSGQPAGTYTFMATDLLGCTAIATVTLNTLNGEMQAGTIGSSQERCDVGTLDPFTGTTASGGDNGQYQWQISYNGTDWTAAPGDASGQQYDFLGVAYNYFLLRRAWISQSCGTVYSNAVTITVWPSYADTVTATVCQNVPYQGYGFQITGAQTVEAGEYAFEQQLSTGHCDSIIVLLLTVLPQYEFHYQEQICEGDGYEGHGFSVAPLETVGESLIQRTHTFQTVQGCDSVLELELSVVDTSTTIVSLTEDFCDEHLAVLVAQSQLSDYVWSTGEQGPQVTVTESGTYAVTVAQDGCVNDATYQVEVCEWQLFLPNAISPGNGDGLNDYLFIPERTQHQIADFEIAIYNRWGELVFYSRDVGFQWNGEVNGKLMLENTYQYVIRCTNREGRPLLFKGTLTVL